MNSYTMACPFWKRFKLFEKFLKPESVNRSDLINSVYLRLSFSILPSHVFSKHRSDYRLKCSLCLRFPPLIFYLSVQHKLVYNDVKLFHQVQVFTPEYLNANNKLHETFLSSQFTVLNISTFKKMNNKSFYLLLIILSVDLSLKPGPVWKHQTLKMME